MYLSICLSIYQKTLVQPTNHTDRSPSTQETCSLIGPECVPGRGMIIYRHTGAPGTHRDGRVLPPPHRLPQPSPAQPQGPGSHLDALNGTLKIGPKAGH